VPRKPHKPLGDVFLNIPYDKKFENLCLAYISGVSAFGLVARATLEIPGGTRRLDRIFHLMQSCQYSVHDLSRVKLDRKRPRTPRFNMPFELGMSVAWAQTGGQKHEWFVFESMDHRLAKSLSDLNGTDPYIHRGTVAGVFRELCNAFVRSGRQPTIQQMWRIYRDVRKNLPRILRRAGASSIYNARVFKDICVVASASADARVA
jgi:hypothetical protein